MDPQLDIKEQVIVNQNPYPNLQASDATISVSEPLINQTEPSSFFTYLVKGSDSKGQFQIRRRYSDFDTLRNKLCELFIGLYIPPLPGKRSAGDKLLKKNHDENRYVEFRKKFLDYFCNKISKMPFLYQSQPFQIFIRGGPDYERELNKNQEKLSFAVLLPIYQSIKAYKEANLQGANFKDFIVQNEIEYEKLIKSQQNLQSIKTQIAKAVDSQIEYDSQFNLCMTKFFPDYQEKVLLLHAKNDRGQLILNKNQDFFDKLGEFKQATSSNKFLDYLQVVIYQIRQALALIEAIKGRKAAQEERINLHDKIVDKNIELNKLKGGQTTFRSIFTSGTKEAQAQELQSKIPHLQINLDSLEKMIAVMVVTSNQNIKQNKHKIGEQYSKVLKGVAEKEITDLKLANELLKIPLSS